MGGYIDLTPQRVRSIAKTVAKKDRELLLSVADSLEHHDEVIDGLQSAEREKLQQQMADCRSRVAKTETEIGHIRRAAAACFSLNARQHDRNLHPYTCGNDSTHRPLIATVTGWRCADCDYTQALFGDHVADAMVEQL